MRQSKSLDRSLCVAALVFFSASTHAEEVLPPAILLVPVSVLVACAWGAASAVKARIAIKILRLSYIIDLSICAFAMGFSANSIYGGLKDSFLAVGICLVASVAAYGVGWIFGKIYRYATVSNENSCSNV